jgi:hypothetical protein
VREVGADKRLLVGRRFSVSLEIMADLPEALAEEFFDCIVAVSEFTEHFAEDARGVGFRQSHHPLDNSSRDAFSGGTKWPHEHARAIWCQCRPNACCMERGL